MKRFLKLVGTGPNSNRNLTRAEAGEALGLILDGQATPAQARGFLIGARGCRGSRPRSCWAIWMRCRRG